MANSPADCSLPDVYLECPVCLHLFTSPVLTDCCHTTVCRACITNCIRFKMGCPICRAALKAKPDKAWIRNRQLESICDNVRACRGDAVPPSPAAEWPMPPEPQQPAEEAAPQAPLGAWLRPLLWPLHRHLPAAAAAAAAAGAGAGAAGGARAPRAESRLWMWVLLGALLLQWSGLDLCGTGGRLLLAAVGMTLMWLRSALGHYSRLLLAVLECGCGAAVRWGPGVLKTALELAAASAWCLGHVLWWTGLLLLRALGAAAVLCRG